MGICTSYHTQLERRYLYDCFDGHISDTYDVEVGECLGTRERDRCSCDGDKTKCDFYPEVRLKAQKETTEYKIKEAINLLKSNGYVVFKEI